MTELLSCRSKALVGKELFEIGIALKKEVNELCQQQGKAARYPLESEQEGEDNDG